MCTLSFSNTINKTTDIKGKVFKNKDVNYCDGEAIAIWL